MDFRQWLRAFFDVPIHYLPGTLLIPAIFSTKFLFGDFPPWPGFTGFLMAWILFFIPWVLAIVPIQLSYTHLPEWMRPADMNSARAIPFHVVVIGSWAVLGSLVGGFLVSPLFPSMAADPTGEYREIPGLAFLAVVVVTPIAMRGITYRLDIHDAQMRAIHAQREALAAQVQALQARIEPHFLFNSLNTVASLIGEDPQRAERAVEKLSELFRYALDASPERLVPLSQELGSVETFLELERLRFPDRLQVSLHVEPDTGGVLVPPLFLQPLVENAIRHGIASRVEGGRLELEIARADGELRVRVEDDGPGPGGSSHQGAGAALADLRKRLELLYAERASLEVGRGPLGGCCVLLRLPT